MNEKFFFSSKAVHNVSFKYIQNKKSLDAM